ncbi:hypothetical protein [Nannocystis sp. SCPEA4]|uniref:hypothetical protein n=1 Tax=Nannocystis sp. SCPEA4 TaxID=2996787 RepID=UPI00226F9CBC|nr:hypothetical protein [Nannocystis sp. SCPEA4]MCY1058241.1 hypothetical protein [Nannocystis sp. SCPEA4]
MTASRLALPILLLVACGDDNTTTDGAITQSSTLATTSTSTLSGSDSEVPTTTASASDSSGSAGQTEGQTTTPTTGTTTTGDSSTTMPVASTSTSESTTTTSGTTGPDTTTTTTTTGNDTDCGGGGVIAFSHIWISNSPEGTVSKIDTLTLTEVGRYRTGANLTDPSRTSVNLKGDVAVTNRDGSITKIGAIDEHCKDTNGVPGIQTSTGPLDVKAWGQDDCVLWNTPLLTAARPAAWTSGDKVDPNDPCSELVDEKVWTSAPTGNDAFVYLLDGETGAIVGQVLVLGANGGLGIYGGAVDSNNDFWGVTYSAGPLVHVTYDTMQAETIPLPGGASAYGFTVDSKGRSWVGGWDGNLHRYDPADASWVKVAIPPQYPVLSRGMMEDENGDLWVAALFQPVGLLRVHTDTATFVEHVGAAALPGVQEPTGASVDVQGKVWLVDQYKDGGGAFVYDPVTKTSQWVGGLNGPYTYSDMTGFALKNVAPM